MYLDLHTHSVSSDDSRATVEQFAKWVGVLRNKGYLIDGFVLTEHRQFDFDKDYSNLAVDNGIVILKGSEIDTNYGHFLIYGVTEELTKRIDFSRVGVDAFQLLHATHECGGIAVPAHPGRLGIGLYEYIKEGVDFRAIRLVEGLNGGNRPIEQARTNELIGQYGYMGTGGSDAHLVSDLGTRMTRFDNEIACEGDLVSELHAGNFQAVHLEDTQA